MTMLTNKEKQQIEKVLEEKLGTDSNIVKNLNDNILLNVKEILVAYREAHLKADSDIYEKRADKLARQLQTILTASINNFNVSTEKLRDTMGEIAESKVHSIVNSKLDKLLTNFETMNGQMEVLADDIVNTREKTIYYAYINAMSKKPIKTILFTMLFAGFFLGSTLKLYGLELDLLQIGESIFQFIFYKIFRITT